MATKVEARPVSVAVCDWKRAAGVCTAPGPAQLQTMPSRLPSVVASASVKAK